MSETMTELKPCPFCGANPHKGLTKASSCQLHGEPIQSYRIWCPKGHASVDAGTEKLARSDWNHRASPAPDRVSVTVTDEIVKSAFRSFVKARDEFIAAHSAGDKPFDLTTFDLDKCTKHALEAALSEASK